MAQSSIKEALENARKLAQRYLDCTTDDMPSEIKMPTVNELGDALCTLLATLQPSGERREAIARVLIQYGDFGLTLEDETRNALNCIDDLLAFGLVEDEAAIRADEREKCAKIAESCHGVDEGDLPSDVRAGERIAAAIRSARNGGGFMRLTEAQRALIVAMGFRSNVLANGDEYSPKWWLEGGGAVKANVAESLVKRGLVTLTRHQGGQPGIQFYTVNRCGRRALAQSEDASRKRGE